MGPVYSIKKAGNSCAPHISVEIDMQPWAKAKTFPFTDLRQPAGAFA
jgi:hypothetical protein